MLKHSASSTVSHCDSVGTGVGTGTGAVRANCAPTARGACALVRLQAMPVQAPLQPVKR